MDLIVDAFEDYRRTLDIGLVKRIAPYTSKSEGEIKEMLMRSLEIPEKATYKGHLSTCADKLRKTETKRNK